MHSYAGGRPNALPAERRGSRPNCLKTPWNWHARHRRIVPGTGRPHGRDFRRRPREESTLRRLLVSLLIVLALILGLGSLFITLYLIKSWLGIDIFQNYHLGLWDWLLNHRQSL